MVLILLIVGERETVPAVYVRRSAAQLFSQTPPKENRRRTEVIRKTLSFGSSGFAIADELATAGNSDGHVAEKRRVTISISSNRGKGEAAIRRR